ncbi:MULTISPECIES: TetR/AcrR family transcriptional regulator [Bosea]|uniref:TetR/AcrR family transcriptional regulator n=1 Tax=Bosea TaxID=85413 RepID=UPI0021502A71|nr:MULTISPECIES: TetR/AcrR family transcriptional regulator [Bosea]MCR4522804.1 TetR/AcrR family transcriptional regulator [Bosea sp. 47.2.35]MDR6826575.1 AcrR family transcriptional regulator [Bosea robiniae]MDR6893285.1 AcrR family transcriptional regulator [Bosea sp. BE109]MDR7137016.1 AcrR family transcriptional regulator [Bosea sp. BE168]MDR7173715.1 AcrR family transcriptional regulator [Bosea sp. BE271]
METKPKRRASIGARRSPETEAAVKDAARAVLAEKGYAGFSIEEVARRAGAGKPTIYRWWPNKADLFIAIYGANKDAAIPVPDEGSLRADLLRYTRDLWRFWREDTAGRVFKGLIAEAQTSDSALDALRFKFMPERLAAPREIFVRAAERGEFEPDEIDDRLELWVAFNWLHALTDRLNEDEPSLSRKIDLLCR